MCAVSMEVVVAIPEVSERLPGVVCFGHSRKLCVACACYLALMVAASETAMALQLLRDSVLTLTVTTIQCCASLCTSCQYKGYENGTVYCELIFPRLNAAT